MSHNNIRKMTAVDLALVLSWRNHPDVRSYMYNQHEITMEEHRRWFEKNVDAPGRHLLIFEIGASPMGFVNFTQLNQGGVVDWGFYLSPTAPKGSGRQLGKAALSYAFGYQLFHKVCGQALSYNERSINFHRRLGFQQEGLLRDQHFDGQQHRSVVCFGLLRQEWNAGQEE